MAITALGRLKGVRGGFSLIELLTTIAIIAVIIAITVPAVSAGRNAARRSSSETLCASLQQAFFQFRTDNRRLPGVFSPSEMGSADNRDAGMSAMENAILELAGGVVDGPAGAGQIRVGPTTNTSRQVTVDPGRIGQATGKAYFAPSAGNFVAQTTDGGSAIGQNASVAGHANSGGTPSIPDVVDAFGTPILLWVADEAAQGAIRYDAGSAGPNSFVRANSQNNPAVFYYNSNRCFLTANRTGKKLVNQFDPIRGSIVAPASPTSDPVEAQLTNLMAVLGSPGAPNTSSGDEGIGGTNNADKILPAQARGDFIVMSAGTDGVYMGRRDKAVGQGTITGNDVRIYYGLNFKNIAGNTQTDSSGRAQSIDIAALFDDIIVGGG